MPGRPRQSNELVGPTARKDGANGILAVRDTRHSSRRAHTNVRSQCHLDVRRSLSNSCISQRKACVNEAMEIVTRSSDIASHDS